MRPSRRPIVIATRRSRLALAQSQAVADALKRLHPTVDVRLLPSDSEGDRITDRPLAAIGGKGLFTRSIEAALLDRSADLAVHSLKDLPVRPTPGLVLAATPARGEARDALVCPDARTLADLPAGAAVGTSSPRRAAQLARLRDDLVVVPMRGNVDTRLRKALEQKDCRAVILAAAGLQRAGFGEHADKLIDADQMLPAAGQGILALQCRSDDHVTLRRCLPLNDSVTATCAQAERQIVEALRADCHAAVAVFAESVGVGELRIRARVFSHDGAQCLEADETCSVRSAGRSCRRIADDLIARGALRLIAQAR